MIRIAGTVFAGLLGLAFGSFLNVCVSRWPAGESVVNPRSHCRACGRSLAGWENVPLLSWIALRGRCRTCGASIGWRYPLAELAVGVLWAIASWQHLWIFTYSFPAAIDAEHLAETVGTMLLCWLLVALAVLDAEHFWLPDWLTLPGTAAGIALALLLDFLIHLAPHAKIAGATPIDRTLGAALGSMIAASLILLIRWIYWLIRRKEGIGLGDAKLMAMLGAWLGLQGAVLAFGLGVLLGALGAVVLLIAQTRRGEAKSWALTRLPLGTFLS